jgi:hypothetical protein
LERYPAGQAKLRLNCVVGKEQICPKTITPFSIESQQIASQLIPPSNYTLPIYPIYVINYGPKFSLNWRFGQRLMKWGIQLEDCLIEDLNRAVRSVGTYLSFPPYH